MITFAFSVALALVGRIWDVYYWEQILIFPWHLQACCWIGVLSINCITRIKQHPLRELHKAQ